MGLWFFSPVLGHELGHHFNFQYEGRRTRVKGHQYEEAHAILHGIRIEKSIYRAWLSEREKSDFG